LLQGRSATLLIAYFLPLPYLAYYTVPAKIMDYTTDGLRRIGMVTMPNAAELIAMRRDLVARELSVSPLAYAMRIYCVPAMLATGVWGALFAFKHGVLAGRNWGELFTAAAFMGALYIPLTFRFSVVPHHREMAWGKLRQLLG
jgi:hypothetical protein